MLTYTRIQLIIFSFFSVPLIVLGVYTFIIIYQSSTKATLERRESLSKSVAKIVEQRFDHFVGLGIHYTSHATFQKLLREKKWEEALAALVRDQKPMDAGVTRMVLFDVDSTARADYPHISDFDNLKGKTFTDRDWYLGVSRNWEPYITEIYKRVTSPQINIVSVVIPVISQLPQEKDTVLGIVNIVITLDQFSEWSRSMDTGPESTLYFVDQKGQVAGHPQYSSDGDIVNFKSVLPVERLLRGQEGVVVYSDGTKRGDSVASFAKVGTYHWGVVIAQNARVAFGERNRQLWQLVIFFTLLIAVIGIVLFILNKLFFLVDKFRVQENLLLESIGDGVFVTDRNFQILLWNKAAAQITGLPARDAIGTYCGELFRFVDGITHRDKSRELQEAIRLGEVRHLTGKTIMVLRNGRRIPMGDSIAPIFTRGGDVSGAIVVFQDKTAEVNLTAAKDEFLSIAAHQLRTPLGVLRWRIEQLIKTGTKKDTRGVVGKLQDMHINTLSLIKLVNDLLDVSRINQHRIVNQSAVVDVRELVDRVLSEEHEEIGQNKLRVTVEVLKNTKTTVVVDPNLLVQILRNILCNAVDYNRPGGSIGVRLTKDGASLVIAIEDTGIGIPASFRPRIFEKFSRAPNAIKSGVPGSGLGMFVVQSYVKVIGGEIAIESQEGVGTKIVIAIPYGKNNTHHRG